MCDDKERKEEIKGDSSERVGRRRQMAEESKQQQR